MRFYHAMITAYGFWLPNDPRGSGSKTVRAQHIYEAGGEATTVTTRGSVAARPHDHAARRAAKRALKRPAVRFSGEQARAIGRGIASQLPKVDAALHALAIMPDHVHAVVASTLADRRLISFLKASATRGLNDEGRHPFIDHPRSNGRLPSPWSSGGWTVWLLDDEAVYRSVAYVEQNPIRAGLKPQRWSCVTPFNPAATR